jgi:hypothetical protein
MDALRMCRDFETEKMSASGKDENGNFRLLPGGGFLRLIFGAS